MTLPPAVSLVPITRVWPPVEGLGTSNHPGMPGSTGACWCHISSTVQAWSYSS